MFLDVLSHFKFCWCRYSGHDFFSKNHYTHQPQISDIWTFIDVIVYGERLPTILPYNSTTLGLSHTIVTQ